MVTTDISVERMIPSEQHFSPTPLSMDMTSGIVPVGNAIRMAAVSRNPSENGSFFIIHISRTGIRINFNAQNR